MIESLIFWFLILFSSAYAVIHGFLLKGIRRLKRPVSVAPEQGISVIVAARNEEKTIAALLQSLSAQQYPHDKFEIIVVNDRSTDSTASIAAQFCKTDISVRCITIESNTSDMPHKKNALRSAIRQARYDILAFTDADCIVPERWLANLSYHYADNVGAVAGYSPYAGNAAPSFLRYEEFKNSMISAAAVEMNNAFMCTGRNFSYRKSVFEQVGGFEKIKHSISGDDDLFLQLIKQETAWSIRYMISPDSYVRTYPPGSFTQFVNQRTRHISASKYYPKKIKLFYASIHLFHVFIFGSFLFAPLYALTALMIKLNIDAILTAHGKDVFQEEFSFTEFTVNELLLVLYSFCIGPLAFFRSFEWKETQHR